MAEFAVKTDTGTKKISVFKGNLCESDRFYDMIIVSAFKGSYYPAEGTLIGELMNVKNISVKELAADCQLDMRDRGCWISKETAGQFRRIACVELLEYSQREQTESVDIVTIKSAFSTLMYLLEQASLMGIPLKTVALPVLGTGLQNISFNYMISPLVNYCVKALREIDGLQEIVFYEKDGEKAEQLTDQLERLFADTKPSDLPSVFISHSSKNAPVAMQIYNRLIGGNIGCWMAPQSIPTGSAYYDEIAKAINDSDAVVLLLTSDAAKSPWVKKEISSFIGSGKRVIPFQMGSCELDDGMKFLLTDSQIVTIESTPDLDYIFGEVKKYLG